MDRNGVIGLAPCHEFKLKPHVIFYRKMSAHETLLNSTATYAVLDVKIAVDIVEDTAKGAFHQVS